MAKQQKKSSTASVQKGGVKSSRWSERTKANKARAAASRENRLVKAAERRSKGATVGDPVSGKVKKSVVTRDRRELQSARVGRKAEQRRNFSKLSPAEKLAHREAGLPSRTVHP